MSESGCHSVSEFGVVNLDDVDASLETDQNHLDSLAGAATLASMGASITARDGDGFGGLTALFRVRFLGEFVRDISFALNHLAEHSRNLFVLRATDG